MAALVTNAEYVGEVGVTSSGQLAHGGTGPARHGSVPSISEAQEGRQGPDHKGYAAAYL